MSVYKTGTVAVTNGSATVTGSGTAWAIALVTGGMFSCKGLSVPIQSVESDTSLTLAYPWPGATAAAVGYAIAQEGAAAASIVNVNDRLAQILVRMVASGIPPSKTGTLAQRDALDLGVDADQFIFLRAELGEPWEFYRWSGTEWVGPFDPRGGSGDEGPPGPAGEGFNPAGAWNIAAVYNAGDFVSFGGRTFVSLVDVNTGNEPPSTDDDDAFWMFVPTAEGAPGAQVELQVTATHIQWRYVGAPDWTDLIALSALTGAPGNGDDGEDGIDGWSPVLALVPDGERRVLQVADWVGGEGAKPTTGDYVGAAGLTSTIGEAIDIRGPSGSGTGDVTTSGSVESDRIAVYADATGDSIKDGGIAISDLATAVQGGKADTAVQPGDLGTAAAKDVGTSAGNVPELDGSGKLDTSVIPAVAITDVFVVANQAAMLTLVAEKGDIAIRTDINKSFALQTNSPTTLADWKELLTPTDAILSVAGLTGTISASALKTALALVKADVGLGNVDNTSNATERAAAATLQNKTLVDPAITGCILEDVDTIVDAASFEIDPSNGSIQFVTLGANRTPVATHFQNGESVTLRINDGAAFTINWSSVGVVWKGGTAPTLATSGYTEVHLEKSGGVIRGVHVGDFAS